MKDSSNSVDVHQLEKDFAKFYKGISAKGPTKIRVNISDDVVVCYKSGFMTEIEKLVTKAGFPEKVTLNRIIAIRQCESEITEICQRVIHKRVKQLFPCYIPEEDLGCLTIFLE